MTHSLSAAVKDGTITEEAAFCGLSISDIHKLSRQFTQDSMCHITADVLVRLRGKNGDARKVMQIRNLSGWMGSNVLLTVDDKLFRVADIRDVTAVAA